MFQPMIARLEEQGVNLYLEVGPKAVLAGMAPDCVTGEDATILSLHRRDRAEPDALAACLAAAWVAGAPVDWPALLPRGNRVDLPDLRLRTRRYWLGPPARVADLPAVGLREVAHPLLGAEVELAEDGPTMLTGRLSVTDTPWLAEHVVAGAVVLPGAVLADLVLEAAARTGLGLVEELMFEAPLVLPRQGGVTVQVIVDPPDASGARPVRVHSRPDGDHEAGWTRHASGVLGDSAAGGGVWEWAGVWPPVDAVVVELEGGYERLAESGYSYGPAFRGFGRCGGVVRSCSPRWSRLTVWTSPVSASTPRCSTPCSTRCSSPTRPTGCACPSSCAACACTRPRPVRSGSA